MNDFVNDFAMLPLNIIYAIQDVSDKVHSGVHKQTCSLKRVKITRPPAPWMKDLDIIYTKRTQSSLKGYTNYAF